MSDDFFRLRFPDAASPPRAPWPADLGQAIAWQRPHVERRYDDAGMRLADLQALERIGATFGSRDRFLAELTLDPPDASSDESGPPHRDEDYLILSTIHSAKGQEWRSVFVLNVVDGCIPSDIATGSSDEIEEERRLLYVAMTRARDELALIAPQPLLRSWPAARRRPARPGRPLAVRPGAPAALVRRGGLACVAGRRSAHCAWASRGSRGPHASDVAVTATPG